MNNVSAVAPAERFRSRRSLPKRGQIKLRIATNALHLIANALSRTSNHHRFSGKLAAENFRSRRSLPRRGQIKCRIATNVLHSIVYALSRPPKITHQFD